MSYHKSTHCGGKFIKWVWKLHLSCHYLSQCWPTSMLPYGVTRPQWVKPNIQAGRQDCLPAANGTLMEKYNPDGGFTLTMHQSSLSSFSYQSCSWAVVGFDHNCNRWSVKITLQVHLLRIEWQKLLETIIDRENTWKACLIPCTAQAPFTNMD